MKLNDNTGLGNKKVWIPKTEKRPKRVTNDMSPTPTDRIHEISKNART